MESGITTSGVWTGRSNFSNTLSPVDGVELPSLKLKFDTQFAGWSSPSSSTESLFSDTEASTFDKSFPLPTAP